MAIRRCMNGRALPGWWVILVLVFSVFSVFFASTDVVAAAPADVRVVIDVSGSMKRTDPQNLRAPGLRLLAGLLPAETRSGVWTFGQYVNRPVAVGAVDAAWREKARTASQGIGSVALFTNIGEALDQATRDWQAPDPERRRHVILLTDGMVDVSKDPAVNARARQWLIDTLIPRLREAAVAVHAIALSNEADHELLGLLSAQTGGVHERVESAEGLERAFLRMFEQSAPRDALPITDNRFQVDAAVRELTVLIFREPASEAARLYLPGGVEISADTKREGLHWQHEARYDLVTVAGPPPGEWRILAKVDPDNRALIATDLDLGVAALPVPVTPGEAVHLSATLTDKGEPVAPRLREMVRMNVDLVSPAGVLSQVLADDGANGDVTAGDGRFGAALGGLLSPGRHELVLTADGRTFKRQYRQTVEMTPPPVTLTMQAPAASGGEESTVTVAADLTVVDPEGLSMMPEARLVAGETVPLDAASEGPGVWRLPTTIANGPVHSLSVHVVGRNRWGRAIDWHSEPLRFEVPAVTEAEAASSDPAHDASIWPIVMIAITNVLLLAIAGGGIWWWRRSSARSLPDFGTGETPA